MFDKSMNRMSPLRRSSVRLVALVVLLSLTAGTCGGINPDEGIECFDIQGDSLCGFPTTSSSVALGIEFEDAANYGVRVHADDAERYSLSEEILLEFNELTGRSQAVFERETTGPEHVCLAHDIYLVDLIEQRQTVLLANRDACVGLSGSWAPSDAQWEPIAASSQ